MLLVAIGVAVSVAAAAIAYRVTYSNNLKVFKEQKHVRNSALQSALYTYVLVMVICLVVSLYLSFSGVLSKFL